MSCNNQCNPCTLNTCNCEPCVPIYTDQLCKDTSRLKCTYTQIDRNCLNIVSGDTGEEVITKIVDAICDISNASDELIKISSNDNTAGYLEDKITEGSLINITKLNTGFNEELEIAVDTSALCTFVQDCVKAPDNPCDLYLDPNTGNAWVSLAAALAAIPNECRSIGYKFLSVDELGNNQEFWFERGITNNDAVIHLDYKSNFSDISDGTATNSVRIGSLYNKAARRNSIAGGHAAYVGTAFNVATVSQTGSGPYNITITVASGITSGAVVAVVQVDGGVEWSGTASSANTITFTRATALSSTAITLFKVVLLTVNTTTDKSNNKEGTISFGRSAIAEGKGAAALGTNPYALGDYSVALGNSKAEGVNSVGIGGGANPKGQNSIAGAGGITSNIAQYAIALGTGTQANELYSTAIGNNTRANGISSLAVNKNTKASGHASVAVGNSGLAEIASQFALGMGKFGQYNKEQGAADYHLIKLGGKTSNAVVKILTQDDVTPDTSGVSGSSGVKAASFYDGSAFFVNGDIVKLKGTLLAQQEKSVYNSITSVIAAYFDIECLYIRGIGLVGDNTFIKQFASTDVDASTEKITIANHEFFTGDAVLYSKGAGTNSVVGGLTNATIYYVIRISPNVIQLATSYTNAITGTNLLLSGIGTGTDHTFTLAGPKIRKIYDTLSLPLDAVNLVLTSTDHIDLNVKGISATEIKWDLTWLINTLTSKDNSV